MLPEPALREGEAQASVTLRQDRIVLVIVGPTAAGKTALSVSIAQRRNGEIVNADAMAVYQGMDIGTAKPERDVLDAVPHHLVDEWPIEHPVSVAEVQQVARAAIGDILARGRFPIVVGGSGLYVSAILDDLRFPGTDEAVRERLQSECDAVGPQALHARLAALDPQAADSILPTNGRRIVRALEVIELTGEPFTATLPEPVAVYDATIIGLHIDREVLDARIAARVEQMWASGLVAEVQALPGLADAPTASRALGYSQVLAYLAGECTQEEAIADTVAATKKFARRQQRWWARDARVQWVDALSPTIVDDVIALLPPLKA